MIKIKRGLHHLSAFPIGTDIVVTGNVDKRG